jgi:hypothetical protein
MTLPRAKLVEDGAAPRLASIAPRFGVVACEGRLALDDEELRDDAHALEATRSPERAAKPYGRRSCIAV